MWWGPGNPLCPRGGLGPERQPSGQWWTNPADGGLCGPRFGHDQALGPKPMDSLADSLGVDSELLLQLPFRRDPVSRLVHAVSDPLREQLINLDPVLVVSELGHAATVCRCVAGSAGNQRDPAGYRGIPRDTAGVHTTMTNQRQPACSVKGRGAAGSSARVTLRTLRRDRPAIYNGAGEDRPSGACRVPVRHAARDRVGSGRPT